MVDKCCEFGLYEAPYFLYAVYNGFTVAFEENFFFHSYWIVSHRNHHDII